MDLLQQPFEGIKAVGVATVDGAKAVGTATVDGVKAVGVATVNGATFVGDGVKATGNLVATGLEKTIETLGLAQGFQAVFGEDIDKSDAGLEAAFAKVDVDKSGKINAAEMKAYILSVYEKGLDDKSFGEMIATADTNNDGEIDLDEFKIIMRAGPKKSDGAIVGVVGAGVGATVGGVKTVGDGAAFVGKQSVEGIKAAGVATVDGAKAFGAAMAKGFESPTWQSDAGGPAFCACARREAKAP
jgi:EF-hand domain pair